MGGHLLSTRQLAVLVESVTGVRAPRFDVPLWFARLWSPAATLVGRTGHYPLLYTRDTLHALASAPRVDCSKARRELGHDPRPVRETVADLYAFFADTDGPTLPSQR